MALLDDFWREREEAANTRAAAAVQRKAAQEDLEASTASLIRHMWFTSVVAGVTMGVLFGLIGWLFFF